MMLTDERLFSLTEENKSGATLECWSDETGENKREYHVFCDADLKKFARAVIAENNAKVLADLKPATLHQIDDAYDAWELCGDDSIEEPKFYSAETVSALIQERDALAAKVKALE